MTTSLQSSPASLASVRAILDELLQVRAFWPTGNGLVVEGRPSVSKIGLSVNLSFHAIDQAARRGCDLLVAHHPALPSTDVHLVEDKLGRLRQAGISLYLCHESLDCAREFGTADSLARAVQVAVQASFDPDGLLACAVHGITLGGFSELVTRVGNRLGVEARGWKNTGSFGHVAVIPGWGGRPAWMRRAQELGCDTVLTGEALLPGLLFAREAGINLVLAGHQATKTPGVMALATRIARDLKLEVTFIPEDLVEAAA
jgi:putative NIF3 family GTP cyclohydrolase 1 type 2